MPASSSAHAADFDAGHARLAGLILIAAAAVNCAFLLTPILGVDLNPMLTFVSELSSKGQPHSGFFAASDFLTGILLATGVILAWKQVPATRWMSVAMVAMGVFAVATAADAFLPLDCVPSVDATCRAAENAEQVSAVHQIHSLTGVLESTAVIVMSFGLAFGARRVAGWKAVARLALAAGVLQLIVSLGISVMWLGTNQGVGILQRLSVLTFSLTVGMMGRTLIVSGKAPSAQVRWAAPDAADLHVLDVPIIDQPGTEVHIEIHHSGARDVAVFSSGLGMSCEHWHAVVKQLPDIRCILFDRPGLGGSSPRTVFAVDLKDEVSLIGQVVASVQDRDVSAGVPLICVGHSYGGVLAEAFARLQPESVGALVLVDPTDPIQEASRDRSRGPTWVHRSANWMTSRRGPAAVLGSAMSMATSAFGTARADAWQLSPIGRAHNRRPRHLRASLDESTRVSQHCAQLLAISQSHPMPAIPIRVLIGVLGGWPLHRHQGQWLAQHVRRLASLGPSAILTEVRGAHLLMLDAPDEVAAAIRGALS